jgi:branched-chain amino acid transport system substrate-binding protein
MKRKSATALAALTVLMLTAASCSKDDTPATEAATSEAAASEAAASEAETSDAAATEAAVSEVAASEAAAVSEAAVAPAGDCVLDKPFKIGYAADFNLGGIGDVPASLAVKFQIDEINKAGGIGGKPVELEIKQISQDPQDLAAAKRGVQELVDGGANLLMGPPFSDYGLPILEVTGGKIPVLFVTSTEVVLSDPSKGSFLVSFNDKVQGSAAAEFATKKGFKTGVTMSSNEIPYLNIPQAAFKDVFEKGGGKIAKDLSFKLGASDFSSQVNEIAGLSPQPDVIYSSFFLPEAGIFLKQLRSAGVKSTVMSADGFDASLIWTAGKDAEGVFFTTHTFPSEKNKVQPFLDAYAGSGGAKIETPAFGALGSDAAILATEAAKKACATDGPTLIKTIGELKVEGTTGSIDFAGTNGTPKRDVVMLTVTDGKPAFADAFYPSVIAE